MCIKNRDEAALTNFEIVASDEICRADNLCLNCNIDEVSK